MVEQDQPAFVAVLNGLAAIKPGAKLTPEALDLWWIAMRDWPLEAFSAAAAHLAKACEFMPNPFHFEQLRKASQETAAEVWGLVLASVRRGDYRRGVTVGGRADRVVAVMGGYAVLAMSNTAETHFRERRFKELWEELADVEETRVALPDLRQQIPPSNSPRAINGPRQIAQLLPRERCKR